MVSVTPIPRLHERFFLCFTMIVNPVRLNFIVKLDEIYCIGDKLNKRLDLFHLKSFKFNKNDKKNLDI